MTLQNSHTYKTFNTLLGVFFTAQYLDFYSQFPYKNKPVSPEFIGIEGIYGSTQNESKTTSWVKNSERGVYK